MRWYFGAILLLLVGLALGLSLLTYAMYALLGVMLVSRGLSRMWITNVAAERECNRLSANVGDRIAVVVDVRNRGLLPVAWLLLEDVLPRSALMFDPTNLGVEAQ